MIFVNGSIPRSVADEIKKVRGNVSWKGELFALDTKDPVWLRKAGDEALSLSFKYVALVLS